MKKALGAILLICLCLCAFSAAQAASGIDKRFYVTYGESISYDDVQLNIVYPYKVGSKVYLFLPAAWDAKCLTYVTTDGKALFVDGEALVSGETTAVFDPGRDIT